jgi:capsular polysaccharide transport system ATP-binding protein
VIELRGVSKEYASSRGKIRILSDVDFRCERGARVALLGSNGSGKSTLLRIIAGVTHQSSGTVIREMTTSWPLAFGGAFHGALTGRDNVRFICRIYDVPFNAALATVSEFSELGGFLDQPVNTYSSGMRARFSFGLSLAIDFDCMLIDEIVSVGDARFGKKCEDALFSRRAERSMVIVSHDVQYLATHCTSAYVVHRGKASFFSDMNEAIAFHHATLFAQ